VALRHAPRACELMDHNILECTKANLEQRGRIASSSKEIPAPSSQWS
jgi:hypothetical protein